jgi:hypothetical protein
MYEWRCCFERRQYRSELVQCADHNQWVTTQTTPGSNSVFPLGDHTQIDIPVPGDHQYTFQVQSCSVGTVVFWFFCSSWSPTLQVASAANPYCQNGYVWREAAPFDHVCVTPAERSQVAYDKSQALVRIGTPV